MSKAQFDGTAPVTRHSAVIHTELGEEILALNPESGHCYSFTGPSARLWQILENPTTAAEAARVLAAEFEIEEASCRQQVRDYFARLGGEGLLLPAPGPTPAGA